MNAVFLLVDMLTMTCFSLFLFANVKVITSGVGYEYLGSTVMLAFVPIFFRSKAKSNNSSTIALLIFLGYFVLKLFIDVEDLEYIKEVTLGTTGGIIFAILIGMIMSFVISDIYFRMREQGWVARLGIYCISGYSIAVLLLARSAYDIHYADVRPDMFLIAHQEGGYQRPGNFIFIQFMISSTMFVMANYFACYLGYFTRKLVLVLIFCMYIALAQKSMMLAQLIGSNSGFVTVAYFLIMTLLYLNGNRRVSQKKIPLTFKNIFLKIFGGKIFIICIIMVSIFYFTVPLGNMELFGIDTSTMRVTNFGEGKMDSLESRNKLFSDNFIEHLAYNPVFGNAEVEKYTTGIGTYIHSILSILTHFGLVGFILFIVLLWQMYVKIAYSNSREEYLSGNKSYSLFRLMAIGLVLIYATVSAFYTWMPLWFTLGFFGLFFA